MATDNQTWNQILIPLLRRTLPGIIAQDIVGVQPMGQIFQKPWVITTDALVDGVPWYTVQVNDPELAQYIRGTRAWHWYQHPNYDGLFDVDEHLLTLIRVGWSS